MYEGYLKKQIYTHQLVLVGGCQGIKQIRIINGK